MADEEPTFTGGRPRLPEGTVTWNPYKDAKPAAGAPTPCPECGESPCVCVEGAEVAVAPGDVPGQVVLASGMSGPEVEAWQTICNEILLEEGNEDFGDPDALLLVVDGDFGEETKQTTMAVQYALGLDTSGVVDEDTWHTVLNTN